VKTVYWIGLLVLSVPVLLAGCKDGGSNTPRGSAGQEYDIKGKVVAVAADKRSVTLDHEEIPGLMKAMEMKYPVEDPKVLEGLQPGDRVQGRLREQSGNYTITRLEKLPAGAPGQQTREEAEVQANLAKLSPGDRQLAEAQKFCPISGERLGDPAMGVPVKVMVKDQPVFLCCKNCQKEALADPDKTLAKVKELKAKDARPKE
jgi:Cu/Ag efflux protein CusF